MYELTVIIEQTYQPLKGVFLRFLWKGHEMIEWQNFIPKNLITNSGMDGAFDKAKMEIKQKIKELKLDKF